MFIRKIIELGGIKKVPRVKAAGFFLDAKGLDAQPLRGAFDPDCSGGSFMKRRTQWGRVWF